MLTYQGVNGKCYYLSPNGDDNNSGTHTDSPWCTLQKLQLQLPCIEPGDSVLLERGSTFIGSLHLKLTGTSEKKIFIGTYGTGTPPIVKGTIALKQWKTSGNNLWRTSCRKGTIPSDLFVNGQKQPLGRHPNTGYLSTGMPGALENELKDTSWIAMKSGYWSGAEVVAKSSRWTLDRLNVKRFKEGVFYFEKKASYPLLQEINYFIQNHMATLDTAGEWFYDQQHQEMTLYHDGLDPNNLNIEISIFNYGLLITGSAHIIVDGLSFFGQRLAGLRIENSKYITFKNSIISNISLNGLEAVSSKNISINNNRLSDINNNGVEWLNNDQTTITGNKIHNVGLYPGRGAGGNGTYTGFYISGVGKDHVIEYNTFDSTGYSAIDFRSGNTLIHCNFISNFCLTKDDGGGIYTWGNNTGNNTISQNIIIGTKEPSFRKHHESYAHGIYIDDRSKGISINHNTIAYCEGSGILAHNASSISILGNKLLNNGNSFANNEKAQLVVKRDDIVPADEFISRNITVEGNTLIASREDQYAALLYFPDQDYLKQAVTFEKNSYATIASHPIYVHYSSSCKLCNGYWQLSFTEWQKHAAQDLNSSATRLPGNLIDGKLLIEEGIIMKNWLSWPDESFLNIKYTENGQGVIVADPGDACEVLLYRPGLAFDAKKTYRLSVTLRTAQPGEVEFAPLMSEKPWKALGKYHYMKGDSTFRNITFYFSPTISSKLARLNFKATQPLHLRDILIQEMQAPVQTRRIRFLYNTTQQELTFNLSVPCFYANGTPTGPQVQLSPYNSAILFETGRPSEKLILYK
ncbi:right-handed parallel beta-helix repeat-containing protein [Fulvivirga sp. 29W222]|uniref:Right-handed parallel beta-helix repeat-containing protein n=1 Tax=Fulvivirga marina TaxID=2494733 RepID=A0A937G0V8_9BACT|nr:right-handed parallel beta-helix repeat-containing protein [Fulvivirga marina]MBL6448101.1 right-handed parallel beta-helix repeat-containing protein [Fulvivirga marina]